MTEKEEHGDRPLRVTMVVPLFRPYGGGAEKQAELLSIALQKRGVEVEVVTLRPRRIPAILPDDPVPVTRLRCWGFGRLKELFFLYALQRYLLQKGREKIDIVHIHQAHAHAWAAVRAAKRLGRPSIVKCGNAGERFDLRILSKRWPYGNRMVKDLVCHTSCFIALTSAIEDELRDWGVKKDQIVSIPNGVEPILAPHNIDFQRQRSLLGLPPARKILLTVGSFHPKKDHATLFRALQHISSSHRPYLVLIGDGPLREEFVLQTRSLGLENDVLFVGQIPSEKVREYLSCADLFVLPSRTEGLSNALLEAMAHGLPCLVSDIPGNRAVIDHQHNGWLFPIGDDETLGAKIQSLLSDPALCASLGKNAQATIANRFSIDLITEKYLTLYQRIIG